MSGDEDLRLAAQVAYFSGDAHILREAEPWRAATPAERLSALVTLCRQAARFRARWAPEIRRCADEPAPLPPDSVRASCRLERRSNSGSLVQRAGPGMPLARLRRCADWARIR